MSDTSSNNQPARPATRQELYDRLRATTRDEFTLQEMIRLGFWPSNDSIPSLPEQLIRQEADLERELRTLYTEKRRVEDEAAMLRELRKKRLLESRKKREETKLKHEQERRDRAASWTQKKEREIGYVGKSVSGGLNHTGSDLVRLTKYNLPVLSDAVSIAKALNIPVGELRFLTFSREVSKTNHYKRFYLPKKTGGQRLISAPMPRMKEAQYWILTNILQRVEVHDLAHGFVSKRSIVSNAQPHVGAEVVINLDLKDFFPTVTYPRVKGVFKGLGYSEAATSLLALLCTEPDVDEALLDNETWFISNGERHLPQGAPTSPAITNILCRRLDARLKGLAAKLGFSYTRYADDLTFSASGEGTKNVNKLKSLVHQIVESEDFHVHPDKTRVMRKGSRKEVTGIVVNDKPAVDRTTLRKFRALLYQMEKDGISGKRWGHSDDVLSSIQGYANFVSMVDPVKGKLLKDQVKAIVAKVEGNQAKRARRTYPTGTSKFIRKSFGGEPTVAPVSNAPVATPTTSTPAQTPSTEESGVQGFVWKLLGKIGGKKK